MVSALWAHLVLRCHFRMEELRPGEGALGTGIAEAEVVGLGHVSVPTEAEAMFTPIACLCHPEVTGQAGQWLEGLLLRLAGRNSLFEPTRTHLPPLLPPPPPPPGITPVLSQQCGLLSHTLLHTLKKKAVWRRSHGHPS